MLMHLKYGIVWKWGVPKLDNHHVTHYSRMGGTLVTKVPKACPIHPPTVLFIAWFEYLHRHFTSYQHLDHRGHKMWSFPIARFFLAIVGGLSTWTRTGDIPYIYLYIYIYICILYICIYHCISNIYIYICMSIYIWYISFPMIFTNLCEKSFR